MKIREEKTRSVTQVGVIDQAEYHINPENVTHITQILRNMYSAPVLAVIREYAANAVDAHAEAGKPNEPIVVTLPTPLEPVFKVRDFGPGLSVEDTKSLLYGFGSSGAHKRNSNDQIGGFGIGCKCAFAITDSFTYTVYKDGMKRVWSCYLDELDNGKASMQLEEKSKEPSGIEVAIPVSGDLVDTFERYALTAFRFFNTKPIVHGAEDQDAVLFGYPESAATAEVTLKAESLATGVVESWPIKLRFYKYSRDSEARTLNPTGIIMGGIRYDFDANACGILAEAKNDETEALWETLSKSLLVEAPIGWVQLAPNREALQYSKRTKAMFVALYKKLTVDFLMEVFDINNPNWNLNSRFQRLVELLNYADLPVSTVKSCISKHSKIWRLIESYSGATSAKGTDFYLKMTGRFDALGIKPTNSDLDWAVVGSVTITHDRSYYWQSNTGFLNVEGERFLTKHLPFGQHSIMTSVFGTGVKRRPLLVGFIENDLADSVRPSSEQDDVKRMAVKLCAKVYKDWRYKGVADDAVLKDVRSWFDSEEDKLKRQAKGDGAHVMLVRCKDKAMMQDAIKALELDPSDTVVYSDTLITDRPKGDELGTIDQLIKRPSSRSSYRRSYGPSRAQDYAQHSAKWFTSAPPKAGNDSVASQNWMLVDDITELILSDDPEFSLPVISLDKFKISAEVLFTDVDITKVNNRDHDSYDGVAQRQMIARLAEAGLWETLFEVKDIPAARAGDLVKMVSRKRKPVKARTLGNALITDVLNPMLKDHPFAHEFIWLAGMKAGWMTPGNGHHDFRYHGSVYNKESADKALLTFLSLCHWCNTLDAETLNVSDKFKATVDRLSAFVDGRVNDWVVENILDGDKEKLMPFMQLIAFMTDSRPSPIDVGKLKMVAKANDEDCITILEDCPWAWPFILTDYQWHKAGSSWRDCPEIVYKFFQRRTGQAKEPGHLLGSKQSSAYKEQMIQLMTDSISLPSKTNEDEEGANI